MKPTIYRCRLATRIGGIFLIALLAGFSVIAICIFFVKDTGWGHYLVAALLLCGLGYAFRCYTFQALHSATYSLEVGESWVAMRDIVSLRVIPFSKIVQFAERPLMHQGELVGYQFAFLSAESEPITFSTQIVGWADAIDSVHQLVPSRVPASRTLEANIINKIELSAEGAMSTAPGRDTLRHWSSLPRWYDVWIGYGVALAIVGYPALRVSNWMRGLEVNKNFKAIVFGIVVLTVTELLFRTVFRSIARFRRRLGEKKGPPKGPVKPHGWN